MREGVGVIPSKESLAARRVLVVGDVMLDRYWFGAVERISPEAPVPVVRVSNEEDRLGGAANVALNVKTLGARAMLLSMVGHDEAAGRLRALLAEQGVDAILGDDAKLQTIVKLRVIGRSQQLLRVDFEKEKGWKRSDIERDITELKGLRTKIKRNKSIADATKEQKIERLNQKILAAQEKLDELNRVPTP